MMARLSLWALTLLCLALRQRIISYAAQSPEKDISLLSYTITPCGATGQDGHSFHQCLAHYRSIGSPVAYHLVPPIRHYKGLQYFKLPRKGQYRITIAGARGGKGVCSPWAGLAPVFQFDEDYDDRSTFELAIGQQGGDACGSPDWQCLPVNSTIQELVECSDRWRNQPSGVVMADGGGGGGGGTQLQLVNQLRELYRIFLASGGGGEGATFPNISSADNETRANSKNGGHLSSTRTGPGMNVIDTAALDAGVGGGIVSSNPRTVDGKGFHSVRSLFAIGGTDCSSCCSFEDSHGGFGGGGGGCASGGGGGGRGGGNVRNIANEQHPGEGGTSGPNAGAFNNVGFNDRDGFVVFQHEHCGCVYNCTIDSEQSVFWCNCPANTFVSPDGFDCYKEESTLFVVNTNASQSVQVQPYGMVTLIQVQVRSSTNGASSSIDQILSMRVKATIDKLEQTAENSTGLETCGLIVINRQQEIVAAVDFGRSSSTDGMLKVNTVSDGLGTLSYMLDDPVQVLRSSVELHSAFLYHTRNTVCTISEITVNASIEKVPGRRRPVHSGQNFGMFLFQPVSSWYSRTFYYSFTKCCGEKYIGGKMKDNGCYTGPVSTSATNFTNFFQVLQCQLCTEDRPMAPATSTTVPAMNVLPDYFYILLGVLGAILLIVCVLLASSVVVIIVLKRRLRSQLAKDQKQHTYDEPYEEMTLDQLPTRQQDGHVYDDVNDYI